MKRVAAVVVPLLCSLSVSAQVRQRDIQAAPSATRSYPANVAVSMSPSPVILTPSRGVGGMYVTDPYCLPPSGIDTPAPATYTMRAIGVPWSLTLQAIISGPVVERSKAYNAGDVVFAYSGAAWPPEATAFLYRAQNSGVTGSGAALSVVKGAATTDGGITWVNIGSAYTKSTVTLSAASSAYTVAPTIPAHSNTLSVSYALWFATVSGAAVAIHPDGAQVEVSDVSIPSISFCYP